MRHEHQRKDRDKYVTVSEEVLKGYMHYAYLADAEAVGPYDYASVMHYRRMGTIPPGIPIRSARLSQGDIDGVARLYGKPPAATVISTNPPGLEIVVDGESVTTPASFDWTPGSTHVLQAPSPQTLGHQRFVFGRWNDEADYRRTVIADPGSTWFEANYIAQQRMIACAHPADAGEVAIRPESGDGFYTSGTGIEIEASPVKGTPYDFSRWRRRGATAHHGLSSNPVSPSFSTRRMRWSEYEAVFSQKPLFLIDSNVFGTPIHVDDEPGRLPWAFPAETYPDGVTVRAPATVPEETTDRTDARIRFNSWSDGGDRAHQIDVPAAGGTLGLDFAQEYRLRTRVRSGGDDELMVTPQSEDGFYAGGTQVQVTAAPSQGKHFVGWTGDASGSDHSVTVVVDALKAVEAVFARSEPLRSGTGRDVVLEATSQFKLHAGADGYNVLVPPDASELEVSFQSSTQGAEVDLYVTRGREVRLAPAGEEDATRVLADFESTSTGASERIVIDRQSTPPLANDAYHIGLAVPSSQHGIRGTLTVEIRRSGIVRARPRALTFASPTGSDPTQQTIQMEHGTTLRRDTASTRIGIG